MSNANEQGNWLALLKWSLKNSNDGTIPSNATDPANITEEDRAFLEGAMKELHIEFLAIPSEQRLDHLEFDLSSGATELDNPAKKQ